MLDKQESLSAKDENLSKVTVINTEKHKLSSTSNHPNEAPASRDTDEDDDEEDDDDDDEDDNEDGFADDSANQVVDLIQEKTPNSSCVSDSTERPHQEVLSDIKCEEIDHFEDHLNKTSSECITIPDNRVPYFNPLHHTGMVKHSAAATGHDPSGPLHNGQKIDGIPPPIPSTSMVEMLHSLGPQKSGNFSTELPYTPGKSVHMTKQHYSAKSNFVPQSNQLLGPQSTNLVKSPEKAGLREQHFLMKGSEKGGGMNTEEEVISVGLGDLVNFEHQTTDSGPIFPQSCTYNNPGFVAKPISAGYSSDYIQRIVENSLVQQTQTFGGTNTSIASSSYSGDFGATSGLRRDHFSGLMKKVRKAKVHPCPHCSRTFARKDNLLRHKRRHTGQKPYKCELCGKEVSRKDNLYTHMKMVHSRYQQLHLDTTRVPASLTGMP